MSVDPDSIPQYVVDTAWAAYCAHPTSGGMVQAIAGALDALMNDEPVDMEAVKLSGKVIDVSVCPSDVLAAVLKRAGDVG